MNNIDLIIAHLRNELTEAEELKKQSPKDPYRRYAVSHLRSALTNFKRGIQYRETAKNSPVFINNKQQ